MLNLHVTNDVLQVVLSEPTGSKVCICNCVIEHSFNVNVEMLYVTVEMLSIDMINKEMLNGNGNVDMEM